MTPKIKSVVLSLGLAALVAGCGHPSNITKEADHGLASARMEPMLDSRADSPVHTIVMPHDEPVFPPGPGQDEFVTACVVCHSPRYITMQPRFAHGWRPSDRYISSRKSKTSFGRKLNWSATYCVRAEGRRTLQYPCPSSSRTLPRNMRYTKTK